MLFSARPDNRVIRYIDTKKTDVEVIVFLHGWGADLHNLIGVYRELFDFYRIISIDLPGFGGSTRPKDTWSSFEYAEEISCFLKSLGIEKYSIVGHSFGGKIASIIAYKKPDEVKKLVLIAASCLRNKRGLNWYFKVYSYKFIKYILIRFFNRNDIVEKFKRKSGSGDYRSSLGMQDILVKVVNEDLSHVLKQLQLPVFLYWGENDDATPVWMAKKVSHLIKDSGLFIVKNGSHYPFLEDNRIVSIIQNFI
ncbi:MAG: hypothetical protein A2015_00240 [Spirochaetes bacterium GWF1_31_7]|nr:MAG: hypothetical protein A2Y30_04270 [Spirochaetes bacterium GWE1_32_154]OHD45993.1 MAG: hypothetical protein A2Y29_07810 [Spirochaetes bacterium GWE2_31_10]OHD51095.1 MAG: hypothetical protein A2015_00240 [Spirochaetes bacterium GWF1_31_7]